MPNKSKKAQQQTKKPQATAPPAEKIEQPAAQQQQPEPAPAAAYQPFDFTAPPAHLEVLNKKIRATKKKLRKIAEVEKKAGKKIDAEQARVLAEKVYYERVVKDYEEIKSSLISVDFTAQIHLLLGAIYGAYALGTESAVWPLAVALLPPNVPPEGLNHYEHLQQASVTAQKLLQGSDEKLGSDGPTFAELRDEVIKYLTSKAATAQEAAKSEPVVAEPEKPAEVATVPAVAPVAAEVPAPVEVAPEAPAQPAATPEAPKDVVVAPAADASSEVQESDGSKDGDDQKRKSNRNFKGRGGSYNRRGNRGNYNRERGERGENSDKGGNKGSPGGEARQNNRGGPKRGGGGNRGGNRGGGGNRGDGQKKPANNGAPSSVPASA